MDRMQEKPAEIEALSAHVHDSRCKSVVTMHTYVQPTDTFYLAFVKSSW